MKNVKKIVVPADQELWDEKNEIFLRPSFKKDVTIRIAHSLISISEWESRWHIPFLDSEKSDEQVIDYVKCMTLNEVDDDVYNWLTRENITDINQYIADPMTASSVIDKNTQKKMPEKVTSELIYYWMIAYNVPVEFEKWHINRLIMLIRICAAKSEPGKKMSKAEIMRQNRAINAARRAKLHTRG